MTRLVACDIDGTLLDGSTAIAPRRLHPDPPPVPAWGVFLSRQRPAVQQPAPPVRSGGRPVELPL